MVDVCMNFLSRKEEKEMVTGKFDNLVSLEIILVIGKDVAINLLRC